MNDESVMRKYLLGDLPAEERTRLEDEYFADADRFEELVGAENDLIDGYVRGTLSDSERGQFEQHYANRPERRGRVDVAKALAQATLQEREPLPGHKASLWSSLLAYFRIPRPQLQWALLSGAVFLAGILLGLQNYRLRKELQGAQASVNQLRRQEDALRQQIAGLSVQSEQGPEREPNNQVAQLEPSADLAFRLEPHERDVDVRGDLVIPQNRSWVRLDMVLERDEFKAYDAALTAPGQNPAILRGKALQSHSIRGIPVVSWRFRSDSLQSGEYIVELSGETATGSLEPVKSYSFRAARQ